MLSKLKHVAVHRVCCKGKRKRVGRKRQVPYTSKAGILLALGIGFIFQIGDYLQCYKKTNIYLTALIANITLNLHKCQNLHLWTYGFYLKVFTNICIRPSAPLAAVLWAQQPSQPPVCFVVPLSTSPTCLHIPLLPSMRYWPSSADCWGPQLAVEAPDYLYQYAGKCHLQSCP